MNQLLQKHGCAKVFVIPEGLRELMSDISREVLRAQPADICEFIANYLSALLMTREHGILAIRILNDLCDCRPSVSEHLLEVGFKRDEASELAEVIREEIEKIEPADGHEVVKEAVVIKKIFERMEMPEDQLAEVCQVIRNAYRDYWYRKAYLEKELIPPESEEPWELAAERTLEIYKKTRPSFDEILRATEKIQAAYKGYYVRRVMLKKDEGPDDRSPELDIPGPPVDIAESRDMQLGHMIDLEDRPNDLELIAASRPAKPDAEPPAQAPQTIQKPFDLSSICQICPPDMPPPNYDQLVHDDDEDIEAYMTSNTKAHFGSKPMAVIPELDEHGEGSSAADTVHTAPFGDTSTDLDSANLSDVECTCDTLASDKCICEIEQCTCDKVKAPLETRSEPIISKTAEKCICNEDEEKEKCACEAHE